MGEMDITRFIKNGGIPLEAQYMYHHALSLSMQGKKEEALIDFQRAIVIAPRFCEALNAMGNCLDELERYDEAVRKFDKLIEIDPNHTEAWLKREMILKKISFSDKPPADPIKKH
jgi:tetratricopeptide (TPR) repeat protein